VRESEVINDCLHGSTYVPVSFNTADELKANNPLVFSQLEISKLLHQCIKQARTGSEWHITIFFAIIAIALHFVTVVVIFVQITPQIDIVIPLFVIVLILIRKWIVVIGFFEFRIRPLFQSRVNF
jgi:Flp pilus assembly protein TadB